MPEAKSPRMTIAEIFAESNTDAPMSPLKRAQALYDMRRAREPFFGQNADLFGEPAWDILLDLFIGHERGAEMCVSDACIGACVPPSTAIRWLAILEDRGLIERDADPFDARRRCVRLTRRARELLTAYLLSC
jgi:DNA-binding MarR family transcriptional regulator